jgi:chromosome segregation ATPase
VSDVAVLSARVDALQAKVDEAERYAQACRTAVARLRAPADALSGMSVDVAGLRSRSAKIDRARARAASAGRDVDAVRSRVADALSDLERVARTYERRAQQARLDLRAASMQLAYALAGAR